MPKTNMTREPGPMARYETATADGGWLTAWGWDCLAGDLREAGNAYTGARQDAYHDRADDCSRRAEALRAKGGAPVIVDISTDLHARAKRLIAAGEYLPGRAHFAAVIARQAYAVAVERIANPKIESRTGRGTLLVDVAACMFRIAGEPARAEGCRMLCAEIMGVTLDDDNRIAAVSL